MTARLPHCAGPCDQGHKRCPCPRACGLSSQEPDTDPPMAAGALVWPLVCAVLIVLVALAVSRLA